MKPRVSIHAGVMATAACFALAGCHSGKTTPSVVSQPSNISGDYAGTMQDAQAGSGTATATFAQHGATAGGAITDKTATATITAQVSLAIAPSNSLTGTMVIDYASGTTCSFSTTGTYDTSTNVMTGSYTAVTNCTGDTGTYSLTQQCTDTVTSDKRRDLSVVAPC